MPPNLNTLQSPGKPLDPATRLFFEARMQHYFGTVRVHTDASAADTATAMGARAYTAGRDIVFGSGEYFTGSKDGVRLLAHELTHVVQQRQGVSIEGGMGRAGDVYERQADAVADAVVAGRPVGSLLSSRAAPADTGRSVTIQRQQAQNASPATPDKEPEETLVSEGDFMRKAVIDSARRRRDGAIPIVSAEEREDVRTGYPRPNAEGKIVQTRTPMPNYTTCVELANQTFADANKERSATLHRDYKETKAAGRMLFNTKQLLDQDFALKADIAVNRQAMERIKVPLEHKLDKRGNEIGLKPRLAIALAAQAEVETEQKRLDTQMTGLNEELVALRTARDAAASDKPQQKALDRQIAEKRQEIVRHKSKITNMRQKKLGLVQMAAQLNKAIGSIDREGVKLQAKIDKSQAKLDKIAVDGDMIVRPQLPLTTQPKPGEYILLGAGVAQNYGVKKETNVTLGKGAFKHIAVFVSAVDTPSPTNNPNEKWQLWRSIDGGGLTSEYNAIKVCLNDLRVVPAQSTNPWFVSKTTLIGWIDMDKLAAKNPTPKAAAAGD